MPVSDDNTRIVITISKEYKEKLSKACKDEKRTLSNLCSKIIYEYLDNTEKRTEN